MAPDLRGHRCSYRTSLSSSVVAWHGRCGGSSISIGSSIVSRSVAACFGGSALCFTRSRKSRSTPRPGDTDADTCEASWVNPFRSILRLSIGDLLAKIFSFLAFVYLARVLGVEDYGTLEFARALLVYVLVFGDLGLEFWATRQAARGAD